MSARAERSQPSRGESYPEYRERGLLPLVSVKDALVSAEKSAEAMESLTAGRMVRDTIVNLTLLGLNGSYPTGTFVDDPKGSREKGSRDMRNLFLIPASESDDTVERIKEGIDRTLNGLKSSLEADPSHASLASHWPDVRFEE